MNRKARVTIGGLGIHARPIGRITEATRTFDPTQTRIVFRNPSWSMRVGETVVSDSSWEEFSAFSFYHLLTLGAMPGTVIEVVCEGERADEAFEVLRDVFTRPADEHDDTVLASEWEDVSSS